jgi:IPT/TIG domain/Glucodextranase, domain B
MRARPLAFAFVSLFVFISLAQAQSAPSISSLSQPLGPGGTPITISGTGFGATQGASFVTFGSATASVSSWGDASVTATVPNGLAAGNLNITVTVGGISSNSAPFTVIPVIYGLSTYSASPGTQVTITGVGFGDTQSGSTITFNGISSSATSWSNSSIATSVPAGASTGPLVVTVNTLATNSVNFTVPTPAPTVTSLSPGLGPIGTPVTITGTNFGDTQGSSRVLFPGLRGSPASSPTNWSATSVTVPVPTGAISGRVSVMVNGQVSNSLRYVVGTLTISSISPSSGAPGTTVTITGSGFGATQTTSLVTFNGTAAVVSGWSDTQIVAIVPNNATTGNVVVIENNTPSNGVLFTVATPPPLISSISPTSGAPGSTITITGSGFGATQGASTVTFNGIAASVVSWSDTQIVLIVPSGATSGNIVVTVNGTVSNSFFFNVTLPLAITSVAPQSAVPEAPVTIFGTSFGASQGSGQVQLGTVPGTVLVWTDTRIVADVSSQSQSGIAQVFQNGAASNQLPFTVLSPNSGGPTLSPAPNAYGWNNTDVTVTFCPAGGNCSSPQTVTSDGAGQVISGTVSGSTVSVTLNIDKTRPVLSVSSPSDGTTFSSPSVPITGTVSDALSGLASVTCNGIAATFGDSQFSCNISLNVGVNLVVVRAIDLAGNVAGSNFHLTLTGTLPPPNALQITPVGVTMLVGETRQFATIDELGRPRPEGAWTVSDSSLASMSTDGSSILTALAPGQLTLTANVGSRSAQTQINILGGGSSPLPGTVRWSTPPLPDLRNRQIMHAVPAANAPALYSIDEDTNGNAVVRAFSIDGREFWQASVGQARISNPSVPDGLGGNLVMSDSLPDVNNNKTSSILDQDVLTGSPVWNYSSPNQIVRGPAIRQDGALFSIELTPSIPPPPSPGCNIDFAYCSGPSDSSLVVALDPVVGTPQGRWPLPTSKGQNIDCHGNVIAGGTNAPLTSDLAIDSAGTLAIEVEVETLTQNFGCAAPPPNPTTNPFQQLNAPFTSSLSLFLVKPDGSTGMISIHSFSGDIFLALLPNRGRSQPERVIPDGSGGWLVGWTDWSVQPALVKVTHITSSSQTDFSFPSLFQDIFSIVLGDNGAAYATDSQTIQAFDINSGQSLWTYVSPAVGGTNIVGAANGTVIGEDFDQNGAGTILQFDQGGNPSPIASAQPPDLPTSSWAGDWVTPAGTGAGMLGIAMPLTLEPGSLWPTFGGDPSQNGATAALCDCLVQSTDSSQSPTNSSTTTATPTATSGLTCFICTMVAPSCMQSPLIQSAVTHLILVGDRGQVVHGHNYSVGDLFNWAAQNQFNTLQARNENVAVCRVSGIADVYNALTQHGFIDGGVYYFGHSGVRNILQNSTLLTTSELFVGQNLGTDTNISAANVKFLSNVQTANFGHSFLDAGLVVTLNGCNAAASIFDTTAKNFTSIAQLLANNLNRNVTGYEVGMYFSHDDAQHDKFVSGLNPDGTVRFVDGHLPMYMIPEGAPGHKPGPVTCHPNAGECR